MKEILTLQVRPGKLLEVKEYHHPPAALLLQTNHGLQNRAHYRLSDPQVRRNDPRYQELGRVLAAKTNTEASSAIRQRTLLHYAVRCLEPDTRRCQEDVGPGPENDQVQ